MNHPLFQRKIKFISLHGRSILWKTIGPSFPLPKFQHLAFIEKKPNNALPKSPVHIEKGKQMIDMNFGAI